MCKTKQRCYIVGNDNVLLHLDLEGLLHLHPILFYFIFVANSHHLVKIILTKEYSVVNSLFFGKKIAGNKKKSPQIVPTS